MIRALSVAGFDPSGSAGIILDMKVMARFNVFGYGVITANTIQNSRDVLDISPVNPSHFKKSLNITLSSMIPNAMKIGMLATPEIVREISVAIKKYNLKNIVLDPVIKAKRGYRLISDEGIQYMIYELIPKVSVITPNLDEASFFLERKINSYEEQKKSAIELYKKFNVNVVVKGGHITGEPVDIFFDGNEIVEYSGKRYDTNPHGTGCLFSSALTSILAKGTSLKDAVYGAKRFTEEIIKESKEGLVLNI